VGAFLEDGTIADAPILSPGLVNVSRVVFTQPCVHFGEHVFVQIEVWGTAAEN
jgi:hypothetical protein